MVIVRVQGGLGNQLFQYAIGRAVSIRRGESLCLDLAWFKHNGAHTRRQFLLRRLCHDRQAIFIDTKIKSKIYRLGLQLSGLGGRNDSSPIIYEQTPFMCSLDLICRSRNLRHIYLDGYWQSYTNFGGYEDQIFSDLDSWLTLHPRIDSGLEEEMRNCNSVSVHVRRTDYITGGHNHITDSYYYNAVREVERRTGEIPSIFVFSDDPSWVKDNLTFNYEARYVGDGDECRTVDDLLMMSHCRHNIITHSTFSWWASWIGMMRDKRDGRGERIVIAPDVWWKGIPSGQVEVYPTKWVVLSHE